MAKTPTRKQFNQNTPRIRAGYDAAKRTDENHNLWANVDALSAAAANNPSVRKIIRERARYEVANNSYASGIVNTLSNDTVGPVIQIQLGDSDKAQETEIAFGKWAKAIKLFSKLRTMHRAKVVDGEAFAMLVTNPAVQNDIKLDLSLFECDLVESYFTAALSEDEIDGIKFDAKGNPKSYRVLYSHPGDYRISKKTGGKWIDAKFILHYFNSDRPGQVRGISEMVSSLSLFGQMRRYTSAVIESASRAAEIAAVMKTTLVPEALSAEVPDDTIIDIQRNHIMSLPEGWELQQFKAEQPVNTYREFKNEIINEIARGQNMPFNVAAGNSSGYNYASGRLDFQTYDRSLSVSRCELELQVLDSIYFAWLDEYANFKSFSHVEKTLLSDQTWNYSGRGHVDPKKEADADNVRLNNGTMTRADYWASQGKDHKRQRAQMIDESIEAELEWNEARRRAALAPMPYPYGPQAKKEIIEVMENEEA